MRASTASGAISLGTSFIITAVGRSYFAARPPRSCGYSEAVEGPYRRVAAGLPRRPGTAQRSWRGRCRPQQEPQPFVCCEHRAFYLRPLVFRRAFDLVHSMLIRIDYFDKLSNSAQGAPVGILPRFSTHGRSALRSAEAGKGCDNETVPKIA
jgi:hypothetical protein